MKAIQEYKELIDRLEAFLKSKLDDTLREWSLEYNNQHGSHQTAKDQYEDALKRTGRAWSVMKCATWVLGEDDKQHAIAEDSVWELRYSGGPDDPAVHYAASSLLNLLTGLDFINLTSQEEDALAINQLENKLVSLLEGQWTDLAFRSQTYRLTDTIPPCERLEELLFICGVEEEEFSPEDWQLFLKNPTEVEFTWYPHTTVGSHTVRGVTLYSTLANVFE